MEMKELAKQLGISHQLANRYKAKGMDTDSLEAAIAWRKSNVDSHRSKTGRIGGNKGVKFQPAKVNENESDIGDMIQQVKGTQLDLETNDADSYLKTHAH